MHYRMADVDLATVMNEAGGRLPSTGLAESDRS